MHENEPEFHRKMIMSDEAQFHLGGYVNKQNCRIWGSESPKMVIEKPLYPQRVTVWCCFFLGGEVKEKIYAVIDEIEPQMCENVMENFIKRASSCKRSREGLMNDIVFHY